jgi:AbrB family looped-hinge helix DNA binding protein
LVREDAVVDAQVVTLSSKGQLVLPRAIRTAAGLHAGSRFTITLEADGSLTIRPIRGNLDAFFQALEGVAEPVGGDLDAEIMAEVEGLDRAARRR